MSVEPSSSLISTGIRSPYEAPEEGYVAEWNLQRSRRTAENREVTNFQERGAYFIRVRTVLDPQGKVVKAWYGKIYGDFFDMWHYLNPDGTRNMEYDTKRNLLKPPKPFDWDFETLSP